MVVPATRRSRAWRIAAGIAAALASAIASGAAAEPGVAAITCTNEASGFTWQIRIDYAKSTVDSYPARISADEISWYDPTDSGYYTLDRASGSLTRVFASSTGGSFLFHRCAVHSSG